MTTMKLKKIIRRSGCIHVVTGLHLGAGRESIEIGGMDNPVLKNPVTGEPYIPGSSLKGKMRSIMEVATGRVDPKGDVHGKSCEDIACPICRVFGNTSEEVQRGPTRLIVRDASLDRPATASALKLEPDFPVADILEEKFENMINRIWGKAEHPRPQERVVPGVVFDFEILYRVFDLEGDDGACDEDLFGTVRQALELIEHDYIGGNGTRGCGQVRFECRPDEVIDPTAILQEVS